MTVTTEDVDLGVRTSDRAITRNRFLRYLSVATVGLVARDIVAATPAEATPGCCTGGSCPNCWSNGCPGTYCDTWYSGCGATGYGWNVCCQHQWNFCHDYIWRKTGQRCVCIVYCGYNCPC